MNMVQRTLRDSAATRWAMLLLVSVTMFANYYFYDALSPLKDKMQMELGFTSFDYGFFVSAYSFPNVFLLMAVIGGIILDRIGIRITGFTFSFLMVAGAALTAYGASDQFSQGGVGYAFLDSFLKNFSPALKMMSLGFFLFGLGAETSIVVFTKVIVKWFKGRELALALGINLAFGRLGMAAAMIVSPYMVARVEPWNLVIWLGTALLIIGLLTFLVYAAYDLKLDRQEKLSLEMDPTEEFHLSDLGKLLRNPSFIYITLLCVTFYSAVFPFVKFAPDLLINKFSMDRETAGSIVSLLPFGTLLFTPLFGWLTDTRGKSASLMILGSILLVLVHLSFSLTRITPYIPVFVLGIAFSLIPAAMWPSVAKIVKENKLGTAYGLMFSIQNLGLWAFPMLIGWVLDIANPGVTPEAIEAGTMHYDYTWPILMLAALGLFGIVFALLLKRADKTSGYGLENPNLEADS